MKLLKKLRNFKLYVNYKNEASQKIEEINQKI